MTDPADSTQPQPLTGHEAHEVDRLTRGRPLTDDEVACYIADHQTPIRHGTARVGDEIAEMLRDRLSASRAARTADPGGLPSEDALASAIAYAIARAPVPKGTDTAQTIGERLAPLVIASGYLASETTAPAPAPAHFRALAAAADKDSPARSIPDDALRTDEYGERPHFCPWCGHLRHDQTDHGCYTNVGGPSPEPCGCHEPFALATAPEPTLDAATLAEAFIRIRGAHSPTADEMDPVTEMEVKPCAWCRLAGEQAAEAFARLRTGSGS